MNCPRCIEKMAGSNCDGIPTHTCFYCNGVWIDGGSWNELFEKSSSLLSKNDVKESFQVQNDNNSNRYCPKCETHKLYQIMIHGVELDLCPECSGIFFDEGELKRLLPHIENKDNDTGVGIATEGLFWAILGLYGS